MLSLLVSIKYGIRGEFDRKNDGFLRVIKMSQFLGGKMAKKRQTIEEIIEKKVSKLREEESAKNEELIQIQKELRRYETDLPQDDDEDDGELVAREFKLAILRLFWPGPYLFSCFFS
jgi:hypothetical protein